jgi:hypothetical protein
MLRQPPADRGVKGFRKGSLPVSQLPKPHDLTAACSVNLNNPARWGPLLGSLAEGRAAVAVRCEVDQVSFLGLRRTSMTILYWATVDLYQLRQGFAAGNN